MPGSAEEQGWFAFDGVAVSITEKLTARHPHVFADARFADAAQQSASWEAMKAREREAGGHHGTLADAPALRRCLRSPAPPSWADAPHGSGLTGRMWRARVPKVQEELGEVDDAVRNERPERQAEELGDLLFAIANWARHLNLDPEEVLRKANGKFEARFRRMEGLAGEPVNPSQPARCRGVGPALGRCQGPGPRGLTCFRHGSAAMFRLVRAMKLPALLAAAVLACHALVLPEAFADSPPWAHKGGRKGVGALASRRCRHQPG